MMSYQRRIVRTHPHAEPARRAVSKHAGPGSEGSGAFLRHAQDRLFDTTAFRGRSPPASPTGSARRSPKPAPLRTRLMFGMSHSLPPLVLACNLVLHLRWHSSRTRLDGIVSDQGGRQVEPQGRDRRGSEIVASSLRLYRGHISIAVRRVARTIMRSVQRRTWRPGRDDALGCDPRTTGTRPCILQDCFAAA